jgi:hypothetical protein
MLPQDFFFLITPVERGVTVFVAERFINIPSRVTPFYGQSKEACF